MLCIAVVWLAIGWISGKAFGAPFGLSSPVTAWVLGFATPLCGVIAAISSVRWIRSWPDLRPMLRADIEAARVVEERYVFTEAKRFQEPEHGGLIYFLRTTGDAVLTLFDHESQDLGLRAIDPLSSSFLPKSELVVVRAPNSDLVIAKSFHGTELDAGVPIELGAGPEEWPESESLCNIPWAELESRLGATND
jgi:hypothetical protein